MKRGHDEADARMLRASSPSRPGAGMNQRAAILVALGTLGSAIACARRAEAAASPHSSEQWLPSSNGVAAIAWDRTQNKLVQFLEHPYASASAGAQTRNFAYDSYPGVRVGAAGTWLDGVAPLVVEYLPGTGIVHTQRSVGTVQIDEYDFAPMALAQPASLMLVKVTQTGSPGPIDVYSLFNYHLGTGSPAPGTDSEDIVYDATRDAYFETGPSGVAMAYANLTPSTYHGCTPNNPFGLLNAGQNLADDPGTGGPTTDAVPGFQTSLGSLARGSTAWVGWITALAPDANGAAAIDRVKTWVAGRSAAALLDAEVSAWGAWIKPAPSGATALEASLALESQAMLRMGQVQESGPAQGQILASLAPGQWNIAWVRDMAYATVALVRSGHLAEAKAAIAFQLGATSGTYQTQVGVPYQISVCRYYGNGTEWSDSNTDGPNIEFDGFGLFLWELDEYVRASADTASLTAWWPAVKSQVAGALVSLQESTGLVKADSSIWEVHWNGQQKHFAYTTITAANGLCAASRLASAAGDAASQTTFLAAGQKARDALLPNLRAADGALVQSTEALASGSGWLDAAVIEAIDFGLVDPTRHTAAATLAAIEAGLVPQSARGFMRSDAGDSYSSNEWVFVDLRAERALELQGDTAYQSSLFSWNVAQASDNFGEFSELHDPVTADYAGQAPMVGFGAGAYLMALYDRGIAVTPTCGAFANEPASPTDAGAGADAGPASGDAGSDAGSVTSHDGGAPSGSDAGPTSPGDDGGVAGDDGGGAGDGGGTKGAPGGSSGGCGCGTAPGSSRAALIAALLPLAILGLRRRSR
jgi:GH15 family glucan-1,4-alpha-glucosidase